MNNETRNTARYPHPGITANYPDRRIPPPGITANYPHNDYGNITANYNGSTFKLGNDKQFYDPSGRPTGVYVTSDGRITDAAGTANYGSWDRSGGIDLTSSGGFTGTWQNTDRPISAPAPSGFNLPDVSGVKGPWSASQSQGTSYSGMGQEYAPTIAGWMAQLKESMTPEAYQALISGAYSTAQQQVGQAHQEAQNYLPEIYQQQLQPALQGAINQLAAKNMINSTVGEGALSGAANLAYQSILPQQANLAGQQAGMLGQLAGQEAAYQTAYPVTLGGILSNLGRHATQTSSSSSESQNPLAPYQLVYSTLPMMAQYGNPAASGVPGNNAPLGY